MKRLPLALERTGECSTKPETQIKRRGKRAGMKEGTCVGDAEAETDGAFPSQTRAEGGRDVQSGAAAKASASKGCGAAIGEAASKVPALLYKDRRVSKRRQQKKVLGTRETWIYWLCVRKK